MGKGVVSFTRILQAESTIQIFVNDHMEPVFSMTVEASDTIDNVRARIVERLNIQERFELSLGVDAPDLVLEDGRTVSDYNIQPGAYIYVNDPGEVLSRKLSDPGPVNLQEGVATLFAELLDPDPL